MLAFVTSLKFFLYLGSIDVNLAPSVDNFNGNLADLYFHVCFRKIVKSCHAFVDDFLNWPYSDADASYP